MWLGGSGDPNFFLHISFTKVNIRLHTKNHRPMLPGSALKVCVEGGGWWWWWVGVVVVVCKPILVFHLGPNRFGFKLLTFDLDQAEQYFYYIGRDVCFFFFICVFLYLISKAEPSYQESTAASELTFSLPESSRSTLSPSS